MALLAVGMAGNRVFVRPFLKKQQDKLFDGGELASLLSQSLLTWGVLMPVIGAIALPSLKPWSLRFGIPAIFTAFATLHFLSGSFDYHKDDCQGSPLTNVCRVFVASFYKKSEQFPSDSNQFYKKGDESCQSFSGTRFLRCLEKAAIVLPDTEREDQVKNRWQLCSVEEVEEAKIAVRMIPMWLTFIICGIVSSVGSTYFVEQASHMNCKLGNWKVPLQILLLLSRGTQWGFSSLAVRFLRFLSRSQKYAPPIMGIAIAMIFSILCCITAAAIEKWRLNVIRSHGLLDKPGEDIPMSVYWLLFQFFLLAGLDSFLKKSAAALYKDQASKSMRNYLRYFTEGVSGLGFMFSVLSVYVVGKVSEKGGETNWFQYTLSRSRLDRYYWVLAALCSVNLVVFILVASSYRFKNREARQDVEDG
ncbi:H+/oligopeptide symporter [Handroanthus impetiginosus]|uniref:H+/oligopeptide symporter n=1 Tax=Handroanthus impetiginosus TaxID=429701 RepID=A0A2G9IBS8_9LAMI|nr:H+/oligopeptide symporter [Handroanthus impetiginosus]